MPWLATPRCAPGRTPWRRPGRSWTGSWTMPLRCTSMSSAPGVRTPPPPSWPATEAGTTRAPPTRRGRGTSRRLALDHDAQKGGTMKPTQRLHEAGQSLWLDNITRALLDQGTLARYVTEYSVTGLTSNPTIFDKAIGGGADYDSDIATQKAKGASDEEVFFTLALADLRRGAGPLSAGAAPPPPAGGGGGARGCPPPAR